MSILPDEKPTFWMVCRSPKGTAPATTPQTRWRDKAKAQAAAQKFADANGHPFYVLEAIEIHHPKKLKSSFSEGPAL